MTTRQPSHLPAPRSSAAVLLALLLAFAAPACDDPDESRIIGARDRAKSFHKALFLNDVRQMVDDAMLPFNFDNREVVTTPERLAAIFQESGPAMRKQAAASNYLEVVTYEEFVDGVPIGGRVLEGDEARAQAAKIGFREGDILVRLLHQDEEGRRDGRYYVLVIRENELGYPRVSTYYD